MLMIYAVTLLTPAFSVTEECPKNIHEASKIRTRRAYAFHFFPDVINEFTFISEVFEVIHDHFEKI